jgi:hypothetical protein
VSVSWWPCLAVNGIATKNGIIVISKFLGQVLVQIIYGGDLSALGNLFALKTVVATEMEERYSCDSCQRVFRKHSVELTKEWKSQSVQEGSWIMLLTVCFIPSGRQCLFAVLHGHTLTTSSVCSKTVANALRTDSRHSAFLGSIVYPCLQSGKPTLR